VHPQHGDGPFVQRRGLLPLISQEAEAGAEAEAALLVIQKFHP
tara:strand:+ start:630 stop:758 length:129 start_codon:yes stop_codon:yes gene_type:complete